MDYTILLDKIKEGSTFDRAGLKVLIEECGYNASDSITNHMIMKMLSAGDITRVGRNRYSASDSRIQYHYDHSVFATSVADEIIRVHPYLDFRIFELVQLNEFVNHQIAQNIVFVSVEKDLEDDVFNTLVHNHRGQVLFKPDVDGLYRYFVEDLIVIVKLPTESMRGSSEFWDTRLEKILVDIAVDKLLRKIVYSEEYPKIYHDAFKKYVIDKSTMLRYARRRGAVDKYRDFLVNEACITPEEFVI